MLRSLIHAAALISLIGLPAWSTVWTEEFFGYHRTAHETVTLPAEPIWQEYGFEEGERAVYAKDGSSFTATAWRFNDSTDAMAVFEWKRPAGYQPSSIAPLAVESGDNFYLATGNYILYFEGRKPTFKELQGLLLVLPMTERSALPTLPDYLPKEGLIPGSERYIIGPAGMQLFEPQIPLSVVAFQYSPEVQLADYQTPAGKQTLAIFSYPTPHIARERLDEFRMLGDVVVKRTGPMLVVAVQPSNADEAQKLLGQVNYRATITWDQILPDQGWNMGDLILTAGAFVGLLLVFAALAGLGMAGIRMLQRRLWAGSATGEEMIALHLEDK